MLILKFPKLGLQGAGKSFSALLYFLLSYPGASVCPSGQDPENPDEDTGENPNQVAMSSSNNCGAATAPRSEHVS